MSLKNKDLQAIFKEGFFNDDNINLGVAHYEINHGILLLTKSIFEKDLGVEDIRQILDEVSPNNAEQLLKVAKTIATIPPGFLNMLACSLPLLARIPENAAEVINKSLGKAPDRLYEDRLRVLVSRMFKAKI